MDDQAADDVVQEKLRSHLESRWTIVTDESANQVAIAVSEVALRDEGHGMATLRISAEVVAESCRDCDSVRTRSATFRHSSPEFSVHSWIANNDRFAERTLADAYSGLVARIEMALTPR